MEQFIGQHVDGVIARHRLRLLAVGETEESAAERLSLFIPNLFDFVRRFVDDPNGGEVDWSSSRERTAIREVEDIEDNVLSPMLGLCGNIDCTVSIQREGAMSRMLVPLELKTGSDSSWAIQSARAQLLLYSLMMADRYDGPTVGGLLYFLKTAKIKGFPLPLQELRALLIRRNEMAHFAANGLNPWTSIDADDFTVKLHRRRFRQKQFPPQLPSFRTNRNCSKCFVRDQCAAMAEVQQNGADPNGAEPNGGGLRLSAADREYVNRWMECLDLEEAQSLRQSAKHELWTMDSVQRERRNGRCFSKMRISRHLRRRKNDRFPHIYRLEGHQRNDLEVWTKKLRVGDHVVLSEDGDGLCFARCSLSILQFALSLIFEVEAK